MTFKVDNFNTYMKSYVERIRNLIPQDALEDERKALEYGSLQGGSRKLEATDGELLILTRRERIHEE